MTMICRKNNIIKKNTTVEQSPLATNEIIRLLHHLYREPAVWKADESVSDMNLRITKNPTELQCAISA